MLALLRLDRIRRFAVMFLLVGVFLTGSVDAVACESAGEDVAMSIAADQHDDSGKQSTGGEQHGLCAHGHCHHGTQLVQAPTGLAGSLCSAAEFRAEPAVPLDPSPHQRLTRPPRA